MRIKFWLAGGLFLLAHGIGGYLVHLWLVSNEVPAKSLNARAQKEVNIPIQEKSREQKEADARKTLPFESLVERLPKGKPIPPVFPLSAESKKRWEIMDDNLSSDLERRAESLKALHEKTRKLFVESPGAGARRPIILQSDEDLLYDKSYFAREDADQPGKPANFPMSPGESLARVMPDDEFYFYHDIGLSDFLHPSGFGYIKDRQHVAGFKSHGFRSLGVPAHESKRWRIHHVQLVGILQHEQPVVYLTDKLPSMEQVRQGKVRELDFFEEAALPALRRGDDLYIVNKDSTIRMLGALRATKTCQKCHDAEIGDLLGAFSYTLRPPQEDASDYRLK
jgi:hypothetical protein